jgi:hypothetical protein
MEFVPFHGEYCGGVGLGVNACHVVEIFVWRGRQGANGRLSVGGICGAIVFLVEWRIDRAVFVARVNKGLLGWLGWRRCRSGVLGCR